MGSEQSSPDSLMGALPLPLAQLYRRAHNARDPLEQHQAAYFLWEATLKMLGCVALVTYAERGTPEPKLASRLTNLARPSLGHWWEFVRLLVPLLAEQSEGFRALQEALFGRAQKKLPHSAALVAAIGKELEGGAAGRAPANLGELFEQLVRYRNRELGHGALGQRSVSYYERMSALLLAAMAEVLGHLDVLAGRHLVYIARVWRHRRGDWLIARDSLMGEIVRRTGTVQAAPGELNQLPPSDCLCLEEARPAAGKPAARCSLRPLVVYDAGSGEVFFLNAQRGRQRLEYLCYTSGRVTEREEMAGEQRQLLTHLLGVQVDERMTALWAARAVREEKSAVEARLVPHEPAAVPPRAQPSSRPSLQVVLRVTSGPQLGQTYPLPLTEPVVVGRSKRAHIQLPSDDDHVSRLHCQFEVSPARCRLTDLNTKNGTFVNGQKIATADLKDGDEITLGKTTLRIAIERGGKSPPAVSPSEAATRAVRDRSS